MGFLLKQLGVVVDRRFQFFISVVNAWGTIGRLEINAPLILLKMGAGNLQGPIISIINHDLERLRTHCAQVERGLFNVNLLPVADHVNAADFP